MALYALMAGVCPAGWTQHSTDDGRFIYATNSSVGSTGGATTYSHSHSLSGTGPCCCGPRAPGTTSIGGTSVGIIPTYIKFVLCQVPTGQESTFPSKTILPELSGSCPAGWSEYSAGNSQFLLFTETDGSAGGSVAANLGNHYHSVPGFTNYSTTGGGNAYTATTSSSDNAISAATDLFHIRFLLCRKA